MGDGNYDWLGHSVAYAGDFDGDGYGDFIAGAPGYDDSHNVDDKVGQVYLIEGSGPSADVRFTEEETHIEAQFGKSVSYAGNVDDDPNGYADVVIGAPYWADQGNAYGRAYVFYGEDPATSRYVTFGSVTKFTGYSGGDKAGYSVSFAGDIDGDGDDDDFIVGAPGASSTGKAYIFKGTISTGSTLTYNDADLILTGETSGANFGNAVSNAGDYNDDNYDDVIVGAYLEDTFGTGGTDAGKAHIFYGGSSMDNKVDITMVGDTSSTNRYKYGFSVSNAGDYDNGGFDDVIVGAPHADSDKGYAHLYNFHDHVTKLGTYVSYVGGEKMGYSVSTAGKFNNDDYYDIVVGAPNYGPNASTDERGRAYVFYGGDPMDNTADLVLDGEVGWDHFGWSVSSGNFNDDGYDDVIVGAPDHDYNGGSDVGRAYIFYGGSSPDATADVTLTGENANDKFGFSVSTAGNFGSSGMDPDDYDDAIVGAPKYDTVSDQDAGKAYIFYGGNPMNNAADVAMEGETADDQFGYSVSDAGYVNNDDDCDALVGAPYYNVGANNDIGKVYLYHGDDNDPATEELTFTGETAWSEFGFSVSTAGDVNDDDYDDIIVGAPGYQGGGDDKGRAYIYYGGSSMDNGIDVTLTGEATNGDRFGHSVSTAGNVDNDDYDDVLVGAPTNDVGGTSAGRVYIYYGGSSVNAREEVVMTGVVVASTGEQFGFAVANAGDVNNDGYGDVVTGSPYSRDTSYAEKGRVKVWGDPS